MSNRRDIEKRIIQIAETVLYRQQHVSPIDIFVGMGWLQTVHVQEWRKGKIPYLEKVIQCNLGKISFTMKCFGKWARGKNLKPSQTAYLLRTKGSQREAVFSKSGNSSIEKAYRTHYVSPALLEKKQEGLKEKLDKPPELIAHVVTHDSQCDQCKKELLKGSLLFVKVDKPLCLDCAGFGDLVFLGSGDSKLTRRSRESSDKVIIVVKFSRARKRYERQGILVTESALQKARDDIAAEVCNNRVEAND
jgi:hypothetical protein